MALGQIDLDRLEKALAKGQLSVQVDGQRIEYRSITELRLAIDYVKDALRTSSAMALPRVTLASLRRE
jgi:hypothetical protein